MNDGLTYEIGAERQYDRIKDYKSITDKKGFDGFEFFNDFLFAFCGLHVATSFYIDVCIISLAHSGQKMDYVP